MTRSLFRRPGFQRWLIPLTYAVGAVVMGMILPRIEHWLLPGLLAGVSAQAAVAICSSIASGMIALTGIVFSLTFVMVQFSATAYSPRLVLWVARDPVMSHSLGVFSATFLYALILLAWVDRHATGKVPFVTSWILFGMLLASMGMFIALIERVGLLQVGRMLIFTGNQGRKAIADLYISQGPSASTPVPSDRPDSDVICTLLHRGAPQVVQQLHCAELTNLAAASGVMIEVAVAVGDTVVEMTPLMRVYGAGHPPEEVLLRSLIIMGVERTFEQDPKYAIRLVVDIAIKALSPAINDPTTAVQALDQIEDLLLRLGRENLDIGTYCDQRGQLRLVVPFPTWDDFLLLALDEIRAYGADSVQVMRRMKALIKNLLTVLPEARHPALRHWEQRLQGSIARSFSDAEEKRDASVPDRQGLGIGEGSASSVG